MERIVLNLCGIRSKGGINIAKTFTEENYNNIDLIIYDNEEIPEIIYNFRKIPNIFITTPRYLHPFLNLFISKETKEKINQCNVMIHFGNIGFKTKIKNLTFIQNILPLISPYSSFRNFLLRIAYIFSFSLADEVIVQQKHVANLIPSKNKVRIIGSLIYKKVKQNNEGGFVVIIENNKNKNPKFLINIVNHLIELNHDVTLINTSKFIISSKAKVVENPSHEELLGVFKKNHTYIHASKYETVGLPIYEALNNGMKIVVPRKDYLSLENSNIYKYQFRDFDSVIDACLASANKNNKFEKVPIYVEDWKLA